MTLTVTDLSVTRGGVPVLERVSFSLNPGEALILRGPNGIGKTTLLRTLAGLQPAAAGSIEGAEDRIAYASHADGIKPTLSVRENIALPLLINRDRIVEQHARIDQLLDSIGMRKRQDHLPSQLSGGEMQLTSIARALIHRPKLVLADEPTGNVNPQVGRSIMAILRQTAKDIGCGVLMVTHSPEHAAWADRVCFLKDGRIASELVHGGREKDPAPIHQALLELGI